MPCVSPGTGRVSWHWAGPFTVTPEASGRTPATPPTGPESSRTSTWASHRRPHPGPPQKAAVSAALASASGSPPGATCSPWLPNHSGAARLRPGRLHGQGQRRAQPLLLLPLSQVVASGRRSALSPGPGGRSADAVSGAPVRELHPAVGAGAGVCLRCRAWGLREHQLHTEAVGVHREAAGASGSVSGA